MQYIKGLDAFDGRNHTAVTLGKFDGLHRGHQKLLNRIMKYAQKEDCDSVVCAFDMDRDCLMTNEERRAFLEDKVDYLIEIPFTREMMEMEAEKFIDEILHKKLHASHIVVGTDFNFGHEKRGNHQMLEKYAAKYGYTVDVVEKAYYKDREISSTYIRELLLDGNVPLANKLLGYPYEITSVVEQLKGTYSIYGENFTKQSKVYINGEKQTTKFLNNTRLDLKESEIKDGDQIMVAQCGSSNTIFRTSKTYEYTGGQLVEVTDQDTEVENGRQAFIEQKEEKKK